MTKTIGLIQLRKFCRTILYTGFVEEAPRPVTGLVIAPPERGKKIT
jgi:hypothetical protein